MTPAPILIVGGGFSGAMLAARLAEFGQASVVIDRTGRFGRGVAYSTGFDGHVLNVRSARMSAVEGRPDDFVEWLRAQAPEHADPQGFAPRRLYGLYLSDRLASVEATRPGLVAKVEGRVVAIDGATAVLEDGRRIDGRAVVLATGNPPPQTAGAASERVVRDPWAPGALDAVGPGETIVAIGAGLTMVDVALALEARGWVGHMRAFSLRGLLPRSHEETPGPAAPATAGMLTGPLSARLRAGRQRARDHDWRAVMEGLRPITSELWRAAEVGMRSRFFRHLRPWWDVHRHRIAPHVAARVDAMLAEGRLTVTAARVTGVAAGREGVDVAYLPPRAEAPQTLVVDRVIDCSGPGHAPGRDPLMAPLLASGRARLDQLGLGLDLDDGGRVMTVDGTSDPALFVLGPPARAAFWETVAVPDIRKQIEDVAAALTA
ncbi:MAG TPA: FAD/NAD(P)-binding protein [Brevundimonas sp.]|uniref:FAD/NAD(P)-binding protein n=1 Tax=Brevundimonas sp. TaxID=1871086 RepID=UPI002DEDAAA3|nr:FAD/NAD(P)-binding protein [Brevundimonas sp.]